ncbi:MAG: NAD(P)-dependent alcohol dehydrogenase [Bacteroidota bacterium]
MTVPSTARAFVHDRYGPPSVLHVVEREVPPPGPGEVLVRVHAVSVNPADWRQLQADPPFIRLETGLRRPRQPVLGADVAGRVVAVGRGVERLRPGDAVFGNVAHGGFAQYVCASEALLARIPDGLSFEAAAAIPLAATTALQALRDVADIQPGHRVLINGASGGVGTFAVQIAATFGAEVTAVCSGRNAETVRQLGAAHVIDYTREAARPQGAAFDAVVDLVGNLRVRDLVRATRPGGAVATVGFTTTRRFLLTTLQAAWHRRVLGRRIAFLNTEARLDDLALLASMLEDGRVTPVVSRRYGFSDLPDAVTHVAGGHAWGKVVVSVGDPDATLPLVTSARWAAADATQAVPSVAPVGT